LQSQTVALGPGFLPPTIPSASASSLWTCFSLKNLRQATRLFACPALELPPKAELGSLVNDKSGKAQAYSDLDAIDLA
jgi:hypothetical protein